MQKKIRPDPLIPDHEVLRKIGGGSYGEVWLARGVTGAMRAVKIVYREDFSDERTFEREFEGILRFEPISRDHRGFVNILHVGRNDDQNEFYYYVMELGDDAHSDDEINPVEYEPRTLRTDMMRANGKPLSTNQGIQFPLVELQTQCEMLRALIHKTAWQMDNYGAFSVSDKVSMCNYWANRLCCESADRAMQVHGGLGYSRHKPFEHIYRHHRRYRITEGAEEIQMRRVAGYLFGFMGQRAPKGVREPSAER